MEKTTSALRLALVTAALWAGLVAAVLGGPPPPEAWRPVVLIVGLLGLPAAGGAVAGAKALADLRGGRSVTQARLALALATALVTLGLGLLLAMLSLQA